jgi:hypothetical protein
VHKRLPFYYIATLWVVAIVSVFLIVKPLLFSLTENNTIAGLSDRSMMQRNDENTPAVTNIQLFDGSDGSKTTDTNDSNDLIFYDKTAFIRYFSDKYSEEELAVSYSKAVAEKTTIEGKAPIRVIRKTINENSKSSFSGGFDIRPVPVSNK